MSEGGVLSSITKRPRIWARAPSDMQHILVDTPEIAAHALTWLVRERRDWLAGRYFVCQWDVDELQAMKQNILEGDKLKVRMVV